MQIDCKRCGHAIGSPTAMVSLFYFAGGAGLATIVMVWITRRWTAWLWLATPLVWLACCYAVMIVMILVPAVPMWIRFRRQPCETCGGHRWTFPYPSGFGL